MMGRTLRTAALLAASLLARPCLADPALWIAHGPHATVYLLGSFHALRAGTDWEDPAIRRARDEAAECWFEVVLPERPADLAPLVLRLGLDLQHPLSTVLSPEQDAQLTEAVSRFGIKRDNLEPMRPWFAAIAIAASALKQAGYDPNLGADHVLQVQAREANKQVRGLEAADEQLGFLADLPQDLAVQLLLSSLDTNQGTADQLDKLAALWLQGDVDQVGQTLVSKIQIRSPELYRVLFAARNQAWAGKLRDLLAGDAVVLVTVGAGHLAGPDNLLEQLERQSVHFERVPDEVSKP